MIGLSAAVVACLLPIASTPQTRQPNTVVRESTTTATVYRIERSSRVVTFKSEGNIQQTMYIPPEMTEFDTLKVGDVVTVRFTEAVIVAVRPGAKAAAPTDTTDQARQEDPNVTQQFKTVVTIEAIDPQGLFVNYRTDENTRRLHPVRDKSLLKGLKVGDRVEITLTRARAVSIEPKR
jgi:Cu/Ag efflux protein CusF